MAELKFKTGQAIDPRGRFVIQKSEPINKPGENLAGEIYLATDTRMGNRTVAIKCLRPSIIAAHSRIVELFEKEIQVLCECKHNNIVEIEDYGTVEDATGSSTFFIALEYIEKGNKMGETFSLDNVIDIGIQVSSALILLHSKGVIHRDVKPDNILIIQEKNLISARLADFGLVKYFEPEKKSQIGVSTIIGSVQFACPQQYDQDAPISPGVDIYSLAKSLFSFISGKVPPRGLQPLREEDFDPSLNTPQPLIDLLIKATSSDLEERIETAEEFQDLLVSIKKQDSSKGNALVKIDSDETRTKDRKPVSKWLLYVVGLAIIISFGAYLIDTNIIVPDDILMKVKNWRNAAAEADLTKQSQRIAADLKRMYDNSEWSALIEWRDQNGMPEEPELQVFIAVANIETGNLETGMQDLSKAVNRAPTLEHWLILGDVAMKYNRRETGVKALDAALALDPENVDAKNALNRLGQ